MRHNKKGRKLGTDASHTKAMKKSLVCALFTNDRIKTVEAHRASIMDKTNSGTVADLMRVVMSATKQI